MLNIGTPDKLQSFEADMLTNSYKLLPSRSQSFSSQLCPTLPSSFFGNCASPIRSPFQPIRHQLLLCLSVFCIPASQRGKVKDVYRAIAKGVNSSLTMKQLALMSFHRLFLLYAVL